MRVEAGRRPGWPSPRWQPWRWARRATSHARCWTSSPRGHPHRLARDRWRCSCCVVAACSAVLFSGQVFELTKWSDGRGLASSPGQLQRWRCLALYLPAVVVLALGARACILHVSGALPLVALVTLASAAGVLQLGVVALCVSAAFSADPVAPTLSLLAAIMLVASAAVLLTTNPTSPRPWQQPRWRP